MKEKKFYYLKLTQMEIDDLMSVVSIGKKQAKIDHEDSPKFNKAIDKLDKKIWKIYKETNK